MGTFLPSEHSYGDYGEGDGQGAAALAAAIPALSQLGVGLIGARSEKQQQAAQLASDERSLQSQSKLTALQVQLADLERRREESGAVLGKIGLKKVLLVVGGLVLVSGMITGAVLAIKKGN